MVPPQFVKKGWIQLELPPPPLNWHQAQSDPAPAWAQLVTPVAELNGTAPAQVAQVVACALGEQEEEEGEGAGHGTMTRAAEGGGDKSEGGDFVVKTHKRKARGSGEVSRG